MKRLIALPLLMAINIMAWGQALTFISENQDPASLGKAGATLTYTGSTAFAAFSNPASVTLSERSLDAAVSYCNWAPVSSQKSIIGAGASYNIRKKIGVAAAFSTSKRQEYSIIDGNGVGKGAFRPSDIRTSLGISYRIIPQLSVGANFGFAKETLYKDHSYKAFNADVFVMGRFGDFKAAAGVSDLGSKVTSASGARFSLPTSFNAGAGYEAEFSERHRIDVEADICWYFHGAFAAAAGGEYTFADIVSIRAGYRYGGKSVLPSFASVGAGVKLFGASLNAAYLIGSSSSPISNTLAVSLGYTF